MSTSLIITLIGVAYFICGLIVFGLFIYFDEAEEMKLFQDEAGLIFLACILWPIAVPIIGTITLALHLGDKSREKKKACAKEAKEQEELLKKEGLA